MAFIFRVLISVIAAIAVFSWICFLISALTNKKVALEIKARKMFYMNIDREVLENKIMIAEKKERLLRKNVEENSGLLKIMYKINYVFGSLGLKLKSQKQELKKFKEQEEKLKKSLILKLSVAEMLVLPGYVLLGVSFFGQVSHSKFYESARKNYEELFGAECSEINTKYMFASALSYIIIGVGIILSLYLLLSITQGLFAGIFVAVVGLIFLLVIIYAILHDDVNDKLNKRRLMVKKEFPMFLSKLAILNSGMTLSQALKKAAESEDGFLYRQINITLDDIESRGRTHKEAYADLKKRCNAIEIEKFCSIMMQAIELGSVETVNRFKKLVHESWENRKQAVKFQADKANAKLMIPAMLMFMVIMMLILVPTLLQMNGGGVDLNNI